MSMNNQPIFPGKPVHVAVLVSAANTNRDGSGTMVDTAFVADAVAGGIVERISVIAAGPIGTASSANVVRFWAKVSSTYRFLGEFALAAVTPTASVPGASIGTATQPYVSVNWRLNPGETLSVSEHVNAGAQDNLHVNVEGGYYAAA